MKRFAQSTCRFSHALIAAVIVIPGPAGLAADVILTSPQQCSDSVLVIDFEQFEGGTEITDQFAGDGILFSLSNGEGPRIARTTQPRQFGPQGDREINNFPSDGGVPVNILLDFTTPVNLIAFELRSQTNDDVVVTLRSTTGSTADAEFVFDTGLTFVFGGVFADEDFDQVEISVTPTGGGAILDNIRFELCEVPSVPADLDRDGAVTILDFASFADCLSGPSGGLLEGCARADYDLDGDVDMNDTVLFDHWFSQ